MNPTILRVVILAAVAVSTILIVRIGQMFVEQQRRQALQANSHHAASQTSSHVRLLVFSSEDCRPCHTLQAPAVHQVRVALGSSIDIEEIDAPNNVSLSEQYHILTVPSTVVLDTRGQAVAVNYGFTPAKILLAQIDAVLN